MRSTNGGGKLFWSENHTKLIKIFPDYFIFWWWSSLSGSLGFRFEDPMNSFLTNLDIPSSTMVLLHGRNPMAQNKTFLFLDVIKFQQNRRWSLLLHFQMIITRMWSRSVLPFKMYVFTLMENFEKSTMQKVCTDLAKTLPSVLYSSILSLQMPERNFVWNLQHIRVTTLVLSIRFTVEIKCRSGVIFSIITSLEPWSDHLSFLHRLSQSYSVSPLELFTKPSLIWNILDGVCLWVLSGWSENQKCGRSLFQMHLDLQLHVLLCSCYVRCRFPYMSIIFRKVNIKRSFKRSVLLLYWTL